MHLRSHPHATGTEDRYWRNCSVLRKEYQRVAIASPPFHVPYTRPAGATLRLHSPGLFILRRPPGGSGVLQANTVAHGTMTEGLRQRVCDELLVFNGRMEKVTERQCVPRQSPVHGTPPRLSSRSRHIRLEHRRVHPNSASDRGGGTVYSGRHQTAMHHHRRAS